MPIFIPTRNYIILKPKKLQLDETTRNSLLFFKSGSALPHHGKRTYCVLCITMIRICSKWSIRYSKFVCEFDNFTDRRILRSHLSCWQHTPKETVFVSQWTDDGIFIRAETWTSLNNRQRIVCIFEFCMACVSLERPRAPLFCSYYFE